MGASLGFKGYKPPDDTWRKMKAIYDSCHAAGMDAPDAVNDFFDWEEPTEHGVMVDLEKIPGVLTKYRADMLEGFDVNVTALPKDVTVIRFYISY